MISLQFRKSYLCPQYVALQLDLATLYSRKPVNCEIFFIQEQLNSATQGWSVGSGKKAAKVFKNGRESPGDNTINEPVTRHIQMLVRFLCPIRGQHLSGCFPDLIGRSSPANSTVRRVPVWLVQDWELSQSGVFSGAPKVYSTNSLDLLVSLRRKF